MAGKVRIVTDSAADIPAEVRERLGISVVPCKVIFGEETYLDTVTIEIEQFYEKLAQSPSLPTTSQPSPMDFSDVYQRLLAEDANAPILSIHLSAALSGTYQSAVIAQSMIEEKADITVIDSKSASYGYGRRVVRAAEMAQAGEAVERIIEEVERLEKNTELYFLVESLDYLQKGGRIGKASAFIGSILNIKPILSLDPEGVVQAVDKVRGSKKAMQRIVDLLAQSFGDEPVHATMAWSYHKETAEELGELIKSRFNVQSMDKARIGSTIGTHTGPGTSAVFMHRL
ncbi:DegV family protein [Paenibacillus arenilitoris]|uniref:DegV family protein n=1 Tax=Paenibacillus arenilitoris TaxID=2772299 RepID=A0A927CNU9_9BACL|nr:DegV family protein [Paenibacillus arenilitoris]MBD2871439.1 DegV family protein [Paenibacillus arenilitoris]